MSIEPEIHTGISDKIELNQTYDPATWNISYHVANWTSGDLYLKSQNNTPIVIPSTRKSQNNASGNYGPGVYIEIRTEFRDQYSLNDTKDMLEETRATCQTNPKHRDMLLESIVSPEGTNGFASVYTRRRHEFKTCLFIKEEDLREKRRILVKEVDLVLTMEVALADALHPNSNEGRHLAKLHENETYQGLAGVFVEVVDNDHLYRSFFYYAAKQIIEVPVIYDRSRDSGVYVTVAEKDGLSLVRRTTHYTFDEAKEVIGLYKNREEAMTMGNPEILAKAEEDARQREITFLKHEVERLKVENIRNKEFADQRARDHTEFLRTFETQRAAEKMQRESVFEDKSYRRKDKSEKNKTKAEKRKQKLERKSSELKLVSDVIKYGPVLIMGAIGIYNIFKKDSSAGFASTARNTTRSSFVQI